MAWKVQADPYESDAAVAWFRDRLPVTDDEWKNLQAEARRKSFKVAGVANADMVNDVWKALDGAVANGTTLEDFKAAIGDQLTQAWGGANPARVETIFRTNLQLAYSAGRQAEMSDPAIADERPFRRFVATLDGGTTPTCRELHNTVLAASDPFWLTRQPPLHFRCRSAITTLTPEEAEELAGPARAKGIDFIFLTAPTTDDARLPVVLASASGFVYYVSITGITGTASASGEAIRNAVTRLRRHTSLPIAVGFGIKNAAAAAEVAALADAVVVGSAIVQKLAAGLNNDWTAKPGLSDEVLTFVRELAEGVRGAARASA